ncbi:ran-binding protein 9 [Atheta coriaria]|uniref:ran-binding protein 9 n=1 Tax=Dalotia coriaria TaxID=877792 RepID=UPI0031F44197
MAAVSSGRSAGAVVMAPNLDAQNDLDDLLKKLYPAVCEEKTPLPRAWSPKEKYNYIGLSQSNLRVHYKGCGKTHKDAASVQATHPIPAACGLYYFEVRIVSKGRDGYMGIGLSAAGVNMNRLPGWDKHSYGYHGDDGHSFCSSGTGQPYGPTFTTGDVIGCGVNLVDNTCFYTKNGHHLGTAFTDLPPNLYPTVGLQTPGEVVDANFGQEPFMFDIEDMMRELRSRTRLQIYDFPVPESQGEWQTVLNKMVSSYLIHHGFCNTAEAFATVTDQPFNEDIASIKNRQKILKLVLAGRMGEAIDKTKRLYPDLLKNDQKLLFMLKCRQFIEMVNGTDVEVNAGRKSASNNSLGTHPPPYTNANSPSSPIQTSVIQSTKAFASNNKSPKLDDMNNQNQPAAALNGSANNSNNAAPAASIRTPPVDASAADSDVEMDTSEEPQQNGHSVSANGKSNGYQNGNSHTPASNAGVNQVDCFENEDEDMDVDGPYSRNSCKPAVHRILEFGKELYAMSQTLTEDDSNEAHDMVMDAFSLLAYSNPWASPVGWQLDPLQRERVYASLNSAILKSTNKPRKPPLEVAMAHAQELVRLMASAGIGSSAFASIPELLEH